MKATRVLTLSLPSTLCPSPSHSSLLRLTSTCLLHKPQVLKRPISNAKRVIKQKPTQIKQQPQQRDIEEEEDEQQEKVEAPQQQSNLENINEECMY